MSIFRRPQADPDPVDLVDRLAAYEATSTTGLDGRYASGYTREPSAPTPVPGHIVAPADVPTDRRGAARYSLQLPVRARSHGDDEWHDGATADASVTGLCIDMDCEAEIGFLDVEIDAFETVSAWARVVGCSRVGDGRYKWRLRLVSYDVGYPGLLDGLEPLETGFAPPPVEPSSGSPEGLMVEPRGWGRLLDSATA